MATKRKTQTVMPSSASAPRQTAAKKAANDFDQKGHFEQFSDNLNVARQLWRRYPALVESDELQEPFRSAYVTFVNEQGLDPEHVSGESELLKIGALKRSAPRKSLTLFEIRQLRLENAMDPSNSPDFRKTVAASLTIAESDDREKVHLALCQALYRRRQELTDIAAPLEDFISYLVTCASDGFVSLENITAALEGEHGGHWIDRREVFKAIQEEDQQTEALDSASRETYAGITKCLERGFSSGA